MNSKITHYQYFMNEEKQSIHEQKAIEVVKLLDLIDILNSDIEKSKAANEDTTRYEQAKRDYTAQILEVLKDYNLPFKLKAQ